MEQDVLVHLEGYSGNPLEFKLTHHRCMKPMASRNWTATACFKGPPQGQEAEAWRILLRAVHGEELLPEHARTYRARSLARVGADAPEEARPRAGPPGPLRGQPREEVPGCRRPTSGDSEAAARLCQLRPCFRFSVP